MAEWSASVSAMWIRIFIVLHRRRRHFWFETSEAGMYISLPRFSRLLVLRTHYAEWLEY